MTCELNETFSRADLERIVFYMLSTRLLFYIAQSVISDDRLRRSLRLADPHVPILFLMFWFSLRHFAFGFWFWFLFCPFPILFYSFWFSLRNFNLYYENQNQNLITTFENENQKHKNKNQNRQHRPSCFAGGSIWRIEVSIWRSAALLTMLAHVNYLILPPLIALNQIVSFFQRIF